MGLDLERKESGIRMSDISAKPHTRRRAVARARISMNAQTLRAVQQGRLPKGDVFAAARLAGIMAAKQVPFIIPLCHPIVLSGVDIQIQEDRGAKGRGLKGLLVTATVLSHGPTGVEMEALAAVSVAGLTIYDMCKSMDRGMTLDKIMLVSKSGGRSGSYERKGGGGLRRRRSIGRLKVR